MKTMKLENKVKFAVMTVLTVALFMAAFEIISKGLEFVL